MGPHRPASLQTSLDEKTSQVTIEVHARFDLAILRTELIFTSFQMRFPVFALMALVFLGGGLLGRLIFPVIGIFNDILLRI